MKKQTQNWIISGAMLVGMLALTGCPSSTPATSTTPGAANLPITTHLMTHPSQGEKRQVEGAEATLVTTEKGAMLNIETSELTPGHVYTLWVIILNKPEACATSPCTGKDFLGNTEAVDADVTYGDGVIAGPDGKIKLTAWLPTGSWTNSWYGNGYTNAKGAEIHATINDHGPLIAGQEREMLMSYRHGCTDESLPPPFPDSAKADGAAGPNKCALMQFMIFKQK